MLEPRDVRMVVMLACAGGGALAGALVAQRIGALVPVGTFVGALGGVVLLLLWRITRYALRSRG